MKSHHALREPGARSAESTGAGTKRAIQTDYGVFEFYEATISQLESRQPLQPDRARDALVVFRNVAYSAGLPFGLIYGTLLGAVRERNLISHDTDVDVFLSTAFEHRLIRTLVTFREAGFELIRYSQFAHGRIFSFDTDGCYIDLYLFEKTRFGSWRCGSLFHRPGTLDTLVPLELFDNGFLAPLRPERFLRRVYGPSWRTPIRGHHAAPKHPLAPIWRAIKMKGG